MALPTTRDEFKDFCLRALGAPVLQVNVDDTQIEDRIDQAFYMYQQFHMDATIKTYLKHQVTASVMHFTTNTVGAFQNNETIVGGTSNTYGQCVTPAVNTTNSINMYVTGGAFTEGETITGRNSGATGILRTSNSSSNAIDFGSMDHKYIEVPANVIAVTKIFAPYDSRMSADILFDATSQFNMSLLSNFTSNSIIPYVIGRQYQQLVNDTFRGRPAIRFQRHQGRIYVDVNWFTNFGVGHWIIAECLVTLNPDDAPLIWSDRWLQDYATALLKKQWGQNLSKFGQIALPGGVTLNGKDMKDEATLEIKDLEDRLKDTYQLPIDFMVG